RAGLSVGAAACSSEAHWSSSFRSRSCSIRAVLPEVTRDSGAYVEAVLDLLDRVPPRLLIASHDGSIEAVRAHRAAFERRCSVPLASDAALDVAVSKERTADL